MLDLDAMAVFAEVVEAQGVTAAAARLGISKSAVSKKLRRLEDALGVRLLNRTTRSLAPTEAGRRFYERCSAIVREAVRAEAEISTYRGEPRGLLRVNAPVGLGRWFVLPAIMELQDRFPELEVDLTLQDDYVDLIATNTDVAVRVGRLADSTLIARRISPVEQHLVASPSFIETHGAPEAPAELSSYDWIRYSLRQQPDSVSLTRGDEHVTVRISGMITTNSGEAAHDLTLAGRALGLFPRFIVADDLRAGRLVALLPEWKLPALAIWAVYPETLHVAPKVRHLVDLLAARADGSDECTGADDRVAG